jgi:hypothetical protein
MHISNIDGNHDALLLINNNALFSTNGISFNEFLIKIVVFDFGSSNIASAFGKEIFSGMTRIWENLL